MKGDPFMMDNAYKRQSFYDGQNLLRQSCWSGQCRKDDHSMMDNDFKGGPVGVDNVKKAILLLDNTFQGDPIGVDDAYGRRTNRQCL